MKFFTPFALAAALAVVPVGAVNVDKKAPVLLELFTSEGCSSCPPADRLLESLDKTQPVDGADLIVLSEHVDYWNNLGWSDPFSSPQFSARQRDYVDRLRAESAYTPQLVVDGREELIGSDALQAKIAIAKALKANKIPIVLSDISRDGAKLSLHVESGEDTKATLFIALADNQAETKVRHGENGGRTLRHVAVVRSISKVPQGAKSVNLTIPAGAGTNGLRVVAFLQDRATGRILGVSQTKI